MQETPLQEQNLENPYPRPQEKNHRAGFPQRYHPVWKNANRQQR